MEQKNIIIKCYENAKENSLVEFYEKNYLLKIKVEDKFFSLKDIIKNMISEKLPKNITEDFIDKCLNPKYEMILDEKTKEDVLLISNLLEKNNMTDILIDKYLIYQNNFLNILEKNLLQSRKLNKIDSFIFAKVIEKNCKYGFKKIRDLKAINLKNEIENSKPSEDKEISKLIFNGIGNRYKETNNIIKNIEEQVQNKFYAYILIKYGKTKEEILKDLNKIINVNNLYKKILNKEVKEEEKLEISKNLTTLPEYYYLNSIYTEEFFNTHEEEKELLKKLEELKEKEKIKILKRS